MESDFFCTVLEIREDIEPDYRAPTQDEVRVFLHNHPSSDSSSVFDHLNAALNVVRDAIEERCRECQIRTIRGRKYLIAGDRTEISDALADLDEAGILGRLGLDEPPRSGRRTAASRADASHRPYTVMWECDGLKAASPEDAALRACEAMESGSVQKFSVHDENGENYDVYIDAKGVVNLNQADKPDEDPGPGVMT